MYESVCVCVRVRVCACVFVCVRESVYMYRDLYINDVYVFLYVCINTRNSISDM